jgi:hypothetical protein
MVCHSDGPLASRTQTDTDGQALQVTRVKDSSHHLGTSGSSPSDADRFSLLVASASCRRPLTLASCAAAMARPLSSRSLR